MIYFIHFVPVTVFHVLADKHIITYEFGTIEFFCSIRIGIDMYWLDSMGKK